MNNRPGDEVTARVTVTRATGGVPAGAAVTAEAVLDGGSVWRGEGTAVDNTGSSTLHFGLPERIALFVALILSQYVTYGPRN